MEKSSLTEMRRLAGIISARPGFADFDEEKSYRKFFQDLEQFAKSTKAHLKKTAEQGEGYFEPGEQSDESEVFKRLKPKLLQALKLLQDIADDAQNAVP